MSEKAKFTPIRGIEDTILNIPFSNGNIYFATDTGKMYLDCYDTSGNEKNKLAIGGGGVALIYGNDANPVPASEEEDNVRFSLLLNALEAKAGIGDLILNTDGCFYKVLSVDDNVVNCLRLAVSGSGGSGGGITTVDLFLDYDMATFGPGYTYIYGAKTFANITPRFTEGGVVSLTFIIVDNTGANPTKTFTENHQSGKRYSLDTSVLPLSSDITISVRVYSSNSLMPGQSRTFTFEGISTVEMGIKKAGASYLPLIPADDASGKLQLKFTPLGSADANITETLHVYIDGEEDLSYQQVIDPSWYGRTPSININRQSHGSHSIELKLSSVINNTTIYSNSIVYEGAWAAEDDDRPIIWIGDYDSLVVNYESSYIHFMVYDPIATRNGLPTAIQLEKDGVLINEMSANYSSSGWIEWDISTAYEIGANLFSINCRSEKKEVIVNVTNEGSRSLGLVEEGSLLVNFTSAGRSNLEIKSNRSVWKDKTNNHYDATLIGFNWQNNGWRKDAVVEGAIDNGTYLSIANRAQVYLPAPSLRLNADKDYTIECRLRVRNVQKYSTLVQTLPMYFYDNNGVKSDESQTMAWIQDNGYTVWYDEYGSPLMDEKNVVKNYELTDGVICKWINGNEYGLVIGSQETYFHSPRGVISVRYKEDEVINLSCVIEKGTPTKTGMVYIYLNGILSGADALPPADDTGHFTITSPFVFNSEYCDIDLYRFRIYQTKLSMPDVIHNYLSDMHSIVLYDQNQLADDLDPTQLSYTALTQYNAKHPEALTMPYSVWKIKNASRNEKLPYFKGDGCKVDIEFVNPSLDKALEDGEIDEWFYYTHSPSFKATDVDIDVQGTSSQGYPRRNYKTKYKKASSWVYTKGSLANQPISSKYTILDKNGNEHSLVKNFHMDNETVGVNKFTWKIDYMESSGSYNTGFANLMGNSQYPLYTKHPTKDLGLNIPNLRTSVYGFPVLTFHEYADGANNPSNPGVKYEYIGRYNMNLDKGANEAYGFELSNEQPYIEIDGAHPSIADVAECWELSDNQGTWTSFKFPTAESRELGFGTLQSGYDDRLEMISHFEYRYSKYGDQIDAIGAKGKYDGSTTDADIIAEIGVNNAQKSSYLRSKYINLEKLFFWLDSTDATNAPTGDDKTIYIRKPVMDEQGVVTIEKTSLESVTYPTINNYSESLGATSVANPGGGYTTTFTKDTADYRLEKFRNEFNQHLDKEYCLVYFVLTELLLCYDSRGKNMMMASFGPHELNGEYIWYPIFYDVDTQLGLNNSGAYLWDYDADVTLDGLFSTPASVLWTNFYTMFNDDIQNKYKVLRGADDGSSVKNNLTYEKIAGAYECNPEVFNSYAMKGIRPIVAIGLDEYYKYFATTVSGYFDTEGKTIIEDTPQFAYQCQGDKKLTTELLLRNRLNYIDSWWLGGSYDINQFKQGQFWGRVNGNRGTKTSDTYLNISNEEIATQAITDAKYNNFTHGEYPVPYFDSQPNFKLKPFLKQYVTQFVDENPQIPNKYSATADEANGVWTNVSADVLAKYKDTPETPNEQLVYLPGLDYLSSMGDLSTAYFSEFHLTAGKRLLDITLGSDIPGYKNTLLDALKPFDIADGANSNTKKSLLKKIILSNMQTFDKTIDIQGSEKMQEFRALNTIIPSVYFADGAPLHTVHLPGTITTLKLVENKDLTRILVSKPVVATLENGEAVYADPASYRGLYLENVTDYSNDKANSGHPMTSLVIEGGGLGYGSYTILNNLVKLKDSAANNNTLNISIKDASWTPYELVESGEPLDSSITYYKLTDHSSFEEYIYTTQETWASDTLNNLIYTYNNAKDESVITDLSLLDKFIEKYLIAKSAGEESQFSNTSGLNIATVPTITGEIYVSNTSNTKVIEDNLTSIYKVYFPNLTIRAKYIQESNITKYVQRLDSGKDEVIETLRTSTDSPLAPTESIPTKTNCDFLGWGFTPTADPEVAEDMFVLYDNVNKEYVNMESALSNYSFEAHNTSVLTLYAIFETHKQQVDFVYPDGTVETYYIPYNSQIVFPDTIPYMDDSSLALEETYEFLGWHYADSSIISNAVIPNNFVILKDYLASANQEMHSVWRKYLETDEDIPEGKQAGDLRPVSVYDNVHPEYFTLVGESATLHDQQPGCNIRLNKQVKGKLVIPAQFESATYKNVLVFSSTIINSSTSSDIKQDPYLVNVTHLFFESHDANIKKKINQYTFYRHPNLQTAPTALKYVAFDTPGLNNIGQFAFYGVSNLSEVTTIGNDITEIGQVAFFNAFSTPFENKVKPLLVLGHNIKTLGSGAFGFNANGGTFTIEQIQFGASGQMFDTVDLTAALGRNEYATFLSVLVPSGADKIIIHSTNQYVYTDPNTGTIIDNRGAISNHLFNHDDYADRITIVNN